VNWPYPHSVDMLIYRKSDIIKDLKVIEYKNPNELEGHWAGRVDSIIKSKWGLAFEKSTMVNIPLNRVSSSSNTGQMGVSAEFLLYEWNRGYRIDIDKFIGFENDGAHMFLDISWIKK